MAFWSDHWYVNCTVSQALTPQGVSLLWRFTCHSLTYPLPWSHAAVALSMQPTLILLSTTAPSWWVKIGERFCTLASQSVVKYQCTLLKGTPPCLTLSPSIPASRASSISLICAPAKESLREESWPFGEEALKFWGICSGASARPSPWILAHTFFFLFSQRWTS